MPSGRRWRQRSKVERLRDRGDVERLVRLLGKHDWLVDRDGGLIDLDLRRRIEAVNALAAVGGEPAEAGIVQALRDDDPRVRRAAVDALGPAPSPRAAKALAKEAAVWRAPDLRDARGAALELLVSLGDELAAVEYAQVLVEAHAQDVLTEDEEAAIRRLFAADSGPVAEIFAGELVDRLGASNGVERAVAQQTLAAIGTPAVGALVGTLDDPDRRLGAAAALGSIRHPAAVPSLIAMLRDGDPAARASAACALGRIRAAECLEALVRASRDPDSDVRDAALEALDGMRGIVAMLGAAALVPDTSGKDGEASQHSGGNGVTGPLQPRQGQRTLLQRLLGSG